MYTYIEKCKIYLKALLNIQWWNYFLSEYKNLSNFEVSQIYLKQQYKVLIT